MIWIVDDDSTIRDIEEWVEFSITGMHTKEV